MLSALFDSAGVPLVVVDRDRRVITANDDFLQSLGAGSLEEVRGMLLGEAFHCVNALGPNASCGTTEKCVDCGSLEAVTKCFEHQKPAESDCLMNARDGRFFTSSEFRVRAVPMPLDGREVALLSFQDISSIKRREAMEHVFFHDILNTIASIWGYAKMLRFSAELDAEKVFSRLAFLTDHLYREVKDQKALLMAEHNQLELRLEDVHPSDVLTGLEHFFVGLEAFRDRQLVVDAACPCEGLCADRGLLERVLVNMIKNALEACPPGESVRVWAEKRDSKCRFNVSNPGEILPDVARQIFNRSFSTKGEAGRGLGTYSMKLFGERYLGGRVWFESDAVSGTVFSLELPLKGLA